MNSGVVSDMTKTMGLQGVYDSDDGGIAVGERGISSTMSISLPGIRGRKQMVIYLVKGN